MARKRKGRSVKKNIQTQNESEDLVYAPHSFVIHRGLPGGHITELTKNFRKVMEPFTALSLKERKTNTIKDFVSVAGVLHVSHMCVFTQTSLGMYMKTAKLPRGPTLTYRIHSYSLSRDVVSSLKKQFVFEEAFNHSPLIVLNNFSGEGKHMKLMATTFQNMFPTINLTKVNLNTVRRCVLMNYNSTSQLVDFRHYAIKVLPVGISKGVKKVVQGKVPDLSRCEDISELLTKSALLSESEAEDDPNSRVTLPQKLSSRGNLDRGQSAIRLSELGPRLTLQLIKVEDGLLDGEVLFHQLVHKTEEEKEAIKKKRDEKRKLKEKRRKQQDFNVQVKKDKKQELKRKSEKGMGKNRTESDRLMQRAVNEANDGTHIEEDDDREYYRQEIGEEPEADLFSSSAAGKKRPFIEKRFKKTKKPRLDNGHDQNKLDQLGHKKGSASEKGRFHKNKFKSEKKFKSSKRDKVFGGRVGKHRFKQ